MSVSLEEVLESAGYDIKNSISDANWLLSRKDEWEEMIERAEELGEVYEEYVDFVSIQEDLGNFDTPTFEEWRKEQESECY